MKGRQDIWSLFSTQQGDVTFYLRVTEIVTVLCATASHRHFNPSSMQDVCHINLHVV